MRTTKIQSNKINIGAICNVRRQNGTISKAEIIETRGPKKSTPNEYYVHYVGQDRRLDEWIAKERIECVIRANPAQNKENESVVLDLLNEKLVSQLKHRTMTRNVARKIAEIQNIHNPPPKPVDSVEAELEREHVALTKVKYINQLQLGRYLIDTWYVSPYPAQYGKLSTLYVCEYCLKYMKFLETLKKHMPQCQPRRPPGWEIYRKDTLSIYQIDGKQHKLYGQLLCLLAKLFLDHKTLFFDVEPFLFYVLCETDELGAHIVGYFSKEKQSCDNNNLACILVLPPYQRKGYGQLLIQFSYELSRHEGVAGSPEKPLSDLGRLSYKRYWSYTLLALIGECRKATISVKDLSELSGITSDDILYTLKTLNLLKYWKDDNSVYVVRKAVLEMLKQPKFCKPKLTIDAIYMRWAPPPLPSDTIRQAKHKRI